MKKAALYSCLLGAAASICILQPENESSNHTAVPITAVTKRPIETILIPTTERAERTTNQQAATPISSIEYATERKITNPDSGNGCILFETEPRQIKDEQATPQRTAEETSPLTCSLRYFRPIREAMLEYHCTPNPATRNEAIEQVERDLIHDLRAITDMDARIATILHLQQLVCDELNRSSDIRAQCYLQSIRDKLSEEGAAIDTHSLQPSNCYRYLVIIKAIPSESKRHWYNLWIGVKQQAQEHEMRVQAGQATDSRAPLETILQMRFTENY